MLMLQMDQSLGKNSDQSGFENGENDSAAKTLIESKVIDSLTLEAILSDYL